MTSLETLRTLGECADKIMRMREALERIEAYGEPYTSQIARDALAIIRRDGSAASEGSK
jgi:hypothetical protein